MKKTISLVFILVLGLATEVAKADFIWGTPANLGPEVNTSAWDIDTALSADNRFLFFSTARSLKLTGDSPGVQERHFWLPE